MIIKYSKVSFNFSGDSLTVNGKGFKIDARGFYVVTVLAAVGFFTFSCERCARILHLIITCLNTDVRNQRRDE